MNWNDVLTEAEKDPQPDGKLTKSDEEWKAVLTPDQFRVTRQHGTERAFTGEYNEARAPGIYACVCCGTELFASTAKFNSGTGWPSFTTPVNESAIRYKRDTSWLMRRVEVLCVVCDAHLGHVFPDGPAPTGLRYCINSVSLKKVEAEKESSENDILETATVGGGCFWCTEALLDDLQGVESVVSGYAGGKRANPTYSEVCTGNTGHAEVVQVKFTPQVISYADLLRTFLSVHNPTTLYRQGAGEGSQYRSVIFFHTNQQERTAGEVIAELEPYFSKKIVTEVSPFTNFYKAEEHHQAYYKKDPSKAYCQSVINPKLSNLRQHFKHISKAAV